MHGNRGVAARGWSFPKWIIPDPWVFITSLSRHGDPPSEESRRATNVKESGHVVGTGLHRQVGQDPFRHDLTAWGRAPG